MKAWLAVVPAVFAVMNIAGFALMGADKRRAKRGEFRVPEAVLFAVAFFLRRRGVHGGNVCLPPQDQTPEFQDFAPPLRPDFRRGGSRRGIFRMDGGLRLTDGFARFFPLPFSGLPLNAVCACAKIVKKVD